MLSLYPEQFSTKVHSLSLLMDFQARQIGEMLSLAKFFVKNGELAIKEFERGNLKNFDPLVRDRVCQRHTGVMLALYDDQNLMSALRTLKPTLSEALKKIDRCMQKPPYFQNTTLNFNDLMVSLKIDVKIDKKTEMVFFAHLLTIASSFLLDGKGGITYHIDCGYLRDRLSKLLNLDTIKTIVSVARTSFSRESAALFPSVVEKLSVDEKSLLKTRVSLTNLFIIEEGNTELTSTNAFFCMDAVLKMARERQIPILIKEHRADKNPTKKILFGCEDGRDPLLPIIVVQGYIPEELSEELLRTKINDIGIGEVILTNASLCLQFTSKDGLDLLDEKGKDQILRYREKATQIGCTIEDLRLIHVVHVYPSTMKGEAHL